MDLSYKETEELESLLGSRLLSEPYLASLLEELCLRQIDKEHLKSEVYRGDNHIESQGIIRGTRYFLGLRTQEMQKRDGLDRKGDEA
jgi:hypothetical protein